MKSTFFRDLLTGITALIGLAGLIVTLMVIGDVGNVVQRYYYLKVNMGTAAGLSETSPVTLNGVRIGQVTTTKVLPPPAIGAELTLRVKGEVKIPKVVLVSVDRGFIGDGSLEFTVPPEATAAQLSVVYVDGDTIEGGSPPNLLGQVAGIIQEPLEKLTNTAANIDALAAEYTKLGQRLNEMMEPRTLQDVANGSPPNVRSTLERLDRALVGADAWLNDPALRQEARDTVAKARQLMDEGSALVETWKATGVTADSTLRSVQQTSDDARARIADLGGKVNVTLEKIDSAAAGLSKAIENVNSGNGTLGQLATNPDLYNNLKDASRRLDRALEDFQLLIQKFKAEGIKLGL